MNGSESVGGTALRGVSTSRFKELFMCVVITKEMVLRQLQNNPSSFSKWREDNPLLKLDLRNVALPGVSLRGARLAEIDFRGADFSGADLRGADLQQAYLRGTNFERANLQGADPARVNEFETLC
jgi:uncharacterized protein YjbI with pentapeptide repeats